MATLFLASWGVSILFSSDLHSYQQYRRVSPHPMQHLSFVNDSHSAQCEVIPHHRFDSLIISHVDHLLCAYWSSAYYLWRKVYLGLMSIFLIGLSVLLLSCMRYLYILEIKLSVASFPNIFSQSIDFFFLFMVSLAVQKLLGLIRSHFFVLSLLLWETYLRKHLYNLCQRILL